MSQTLSQKFIGAMEGSRDRLYALALAKAGAGASGAAAEQWMLQATRSVFLRFTKEAVPDVPEALTTELGASASAGQAQVPMPADLWARVAAAVQMEAAQSQNARALNPDSVLLRPDPLLAPKKSSPRRDAENFDLASPSRLIVAAAILVLAGVVVTVYVLTRPGGTRVGKDGGGGRTNDGSGTPAAPMATPSANSNGESS